MRKGRIMKNMIKHNMRNRSNVMNTKQEQQDTGETGATEKMKTG